MPISAAKKVKSLAHCSTPYQAVPGCLSLLLESEPLLLCTLQASSSVAPGVRGALSKLRDILTLLLGVWEGRLPAWYGERRGTGLERGAKAILRDKVTRSTGQRVLCLVALTDGFVPQTLHSVLPV